MHNAFTRIFTFLIVIITFNLIVFAGITTIFSRSLINSIIEKEEESDIIKIQMAFKGYSDQWTLDNISEEQYTFFMDNVLSVVTFVRLYDKDYNILLEKGKLYPNPLGKPSTSLEKELHPIGIEGIDPAYVEVSSSPEKLITRPSLIQKAKRSTYYLLLILLAIFPLIIAAAYFGSRKMTVNIKKVSDTLSQLAEGCRDIQFPTVKTQESEQILIAAKYLQKQLVLKDERANHRLQELTHDLKGPIAGLYNQLESVELSALKLTEDRFEHLYGELGYLNQLIDDMSVLYKLEDNIDSLNCINMQTDEELISPILNRFTPLAEEKGMVIYSDIEEQELWGDPVLLKRGISNLIQNAILYGKGLVIDINVYSEEDSPCTIIEVRNKGQIAEADMPHLFTRYWRKTQDRGGSGLGLSITRMIARKHGGDLTVHNQNPNQVVFCLKIQSSVVRI